VATLVLTVIGDDRAGLVNSLADAVSRHGGNWEQSQLTELAGKFAGIVVVSVPDDARERLVGALAPLPGLVVHAYDGDRHPEPLPEPTLVLDLIGHDRPGIVNQITGVVARHGLSILLLVTETLDAPMSGGRLFKAHLGASGSPSTDTVAVRADLERLANELMVDISVEP
jgi:glycine cleavage system regulatory protein